MTRSLAPWDIRPPQLFDTFRREMDQLMEQFFPTEDGGREVRAFAPRVNVAETDKEYEVTVDLPGMKPEEFNIELKDNQLWVTGEKKQEHEEKGKTWHRVERSYGQFRRVIPLPAQVAPDKVQADYKDGILRVTLAKEEAAQPKKITVKS